MKKVAILYDSPPTGKPLTLALRRHTGLDIAEFGMWFPARRTTFYRYFIQTPLMALFPLTMLWRLRRFDTVLCWQQNFGLMLGILLRLLRWSVPAEVHVLTFIATRRRRSWPLRPIIAYALGCRAIKTVTCYNETELELYRQTFPRVAGKFRVAQLVEETPFADTAVTADEGYFLAAGRENRDYDFLSSYFAQRPAERLVIVCDAFAAVAAPNVEVRTATYGRDYVDLVAKCHAVVFAFSDPAISSGQLVFLLALQLGKPVIATRSGCLRGYLKAGLTGLEIDKDFAALDGAIAALKDQETYARMSRAQIADRADRFTIDSFAKRIIAITSLAGPLAATDVAEP